MKYAVIACEVMRYEIELLCKEMKAPPPLRFLPQGLHDTPKRLRAELQETIDKVETENPELKHLVLGYGFCGKGLEGIAAGRCELVVPRVHDCIPLLMGSRRAHREEHSRECGTYWFSPGWITWSVIPYLDNRATRRHRYVEKYGHAKAEILMEMEAGVLSHYTRACLIEWPDMSESFRNQAQDAARRSGLPLETIQGSSNYLKDLLSGTWNHACFVRIPPGQFIVQSMDDHAVMDAGTALEQIA